MREVAVGTIGFFDGVHLGHRQVIETLVSRARATGREALVITFWPHPRAVLQQDARELRLLTALEEKKQMLLSLGVDRVEVLPFTRRLASLTARQFVDEVLIGKLGVDALVAGYDNRIGSDNKPVSEIPGIDIVIVGEYIYSPRTDISHISSTVIRKKLWKRQGRCSGTGTRSRELWLRETGWGERWGIPRRT